MSHWYEVKKEDIDFSDDGEEVHLWLYQDKFGNVYASVKKEVLKQILDEDKT